MPTEIKLITYSLMDSGRRYRCVTKTGFISEPAPKSAWTSNSKDVLGYADDADIYFTPPDSGEAEVDRWMAEEGLKWSDSKSPLDCGRSLVRFLQDKGLLNLTKPSPAGEWTTTPPTKPGFYWNCERDGSHLELVRVPTGDYRGGTLWCHQAVTPPALPAEPELPEEL